MAVQLSASVRNARLDAIETTIAVSPSLVIYTGAMPANYATAASGTTLATITLPSDWLANASGGTKVLAGTWSTTASAAGTAGYFRIIGSTSANGLQGTVTATGGGGDLTLTNAVLAVSDPVSVTSFTLTDGNA